MQTPILLLLDRLSCSQHVHTCHPYFWDDVLQFSTSMVIHHWAICLTSLAFCELVHGSFKIKLAAGTQGLDLNLNDNVVAFSQFIADNVDDDTETHPGNNTVRMVGIMGTVTPGVRTYHTLKRRHINNNGIHEVRKLNYQIGPTSVYQLLQLR